MSHGQRLGSDPLDWIASALAPAAMTGAATTAEGLASARAQAAGGGVVSGNAMPEAPAQPRLARPETWRALRLKGDGKECKGQLSERLDRDQTADMLETLAVWIREGGLAFGEGGKALVLAVGEELDVEAAMSHKKDKSRLQMEITWKNRKA